MCSTLEKLTLRVLQLSGEGCVLLDGATAGSGSASSGMSHRQGRLITSHGELCRTLQA